MALYVVRNGELTAADTWYNLANIGGETRNAVIVPPGMNSIKEIWASFSNALYTDAKGFLVALKLKGAGMQGVDYEMFVGGESNCTITGNAASSKTSGAFKMKTSLAVTSGAEIWVQGCQSTDSDAGTPNLAVTLVFDSSGGSKRYSFCRWNTAVDTVSTKYSATLDAAGATANAIQLPQTVRHITNIVPVSGGVTLGLGNGGGSAIVRLESGCKDGVMEFTAGGSGQEGATAGNTIGIWIPDPIPTDISVVGGASIAVTVEQTGADWGVTFHGVSIEVE